MKEERLLVTMKDAQRYRVLMDYLKKRLTATQASQILGLSALSCQGVHTFKVQRSFS